MKIADLFVNIGVKGEGEAKKALEGTKTGLSDVASSGLAAKAAIIGVIYGLEQMMTKSANLGTSLLNLSTYTGINTKQMQEWRYAAQQVGESGDSITASIKGAQAAMTAIANGGGPAGELARIASMVTGGIDQNKALSDTIYLMEKLQEVATNKNIRESDKNFLLKPFVNEQTITSMKRNAFRKDVFDKTPIVSEGQEKRLDKIRAQWANLGTQIDMIMLKLTSAHGGQLVTEIGQIATALGSLVGHLDDLAQKIGVFQAIAWLFKKADEGVANLGNDKRAETLQKKLIDDSKNIDGFWDLLKKSLYYGSVGSIEESVTPPIPKSTGDRNPSSVNQTQTVNVHVDGAGQPEEIASHIQTKLNGAAAQFFDQEN